MKKKILIIGLVVLVLLIGIAATLTLRQEQTPAPSAPPTEQATEQATEPATEAATEQPTEAPTQAPTEPSVLRNPFNGEIVDEVWTQRPYAFSINNVKPSMPQHGIGQADIVYEMVVEGGLTRCLAIFSDVSNVEKIGSIRSARIYTYDLVCSCDAILVRCGGSSEADEAIKNAGWDDINGYTLSEPFYRDQARKSAGYALEHTMFTSGALVLENTAKRSLRTTHEGGLDYGLNFADSVTLDGETANKILLDFSTVKRSEMHYDAETGKYLASQYNTDWIDQETGDTLAFDNVLVIFATTWTQEDGVHMDMTLTGEGTGLYACGGQMIPVLWSRSSEDAPFCYTTQDGTPLSIHTGKSYIGIVPDQGSVSWE